MHSLVRVPPGSGAHPTQRDLRLQEQTLVCNHHKPNCQGRRVSAFRVLLKAFHARQTPAQPRVHRTCVMVTGHNKRFRWCMPGVCYHMNCTQSLVPLHHTGVTQLYPLLVSDQLEKNLWFGASHCYCFTCRKKRALSLKAYFFSSFLTLTCFDLIRVCESLQA